jgi:serine/threonine protein kinase
VLTGDLVGNRYRLGDQLGRGGMSVVYRGWDERLGRDVAVKMLRADLTVDASFQIRFRRAAQGAASLNHPAIVAVYDTGETAGRTCPVPYIVVEYVDGETLGAVLERERRLPPRRAMEIVADVCAALDFSHRHGIMHGGVRPATIMVNRAGAVRSDLVRALSGQGRAGGAAGPRTPPAASGSS